MLSVKRVTNFILIYIKNHILDFQKYKAFF
uniref:Uncharacterized protein n=1 Tax=Heterorhabditis bacteriophora TaxID=37862 RepID=A0A1I7W8I0_HETBA